eukprot:TRINITY_DN19851_c0_g1_i1.p1 TRINITY_DN19851_c0_g1~~TRINITY_DN19851_c0_g1_i1.p1  ORF type:complete len:464 (-),score=119.95 TRINITY_DN19851_c0_g1_i1:6-1397(-)
MAASFVRATASKIRRGSTTNVVPGRDEEGKPKAKRNSLLGEQGKSKRRSSLLGAVFGKGATLDRQPSDDSELEVDELGEEAHTTNKRRGSLFSGIRNAFKSQPNRQQSSGSHDEVHRLSIGNCTANSALGELIRHLPSDTIVTTGSDFLNVSRMQYLDGIRQERSIKRLKQDLVQQCDCSEREAAQLLDFILERAWQVNATTLDRLQCKLEACERRLEQLKVASVREITAAKDQARALPKGAHSLGESPCVHELLGGLAHEERALVKACVEELVKQGLAEQLAKAVEAQSLELRQEVQKLTQALEESKASVDAEVKQRLSWSFGPLENQVRDLEAQLKASEAAAAETKEELAAAKEELAAAKEELAAAAVRQMPVKLEDDGLFLDDDKLLLDDPCTSGSVFRASSSTSGFQQQVAAKSEVTSAAPKAKTGKAAAVPKKGVTAKQSVSNNAPDSPKRMLSQKSK